MAPPVTISGRNRSAGNTVDAKTQSLPELPELTGIRETPEAGMPRKSEIPKHQMP